MSAMPGSTALRVPKAGEMVAGHLRQQIIRGDLREGESLPPENTLMEQYGVSRPTLREAFRILESERLIDIRRGAHGGARVLVPDSDVAAHYTGLLLQYRQTPLADVYEARSTLEVSAIATLARKRTAADLRRLDKALEEGEQALDDEPVNYATHDTDFHRLLMELAGNETMGTLVEMVYFILDSHNRSYIRTRTRDESAQAARTAQRAHTKLVELLRQKETDKAITFWRKHLTQVSTYMVQNPDETVLDLLS